MHAVEATLLQLRVQAEVTRVSEARGAPPAFTVEPREAACRLMVQLDDAEQITFVLGRHGVPLEVEEPDRSRMLDRVASIVRAVALGGYREQVRALPGQEVQAVAELASPEGVDTISYNTLRRRLGAKPPAGWTAVEYEPYAPAAPS